MGPNYNGKIGYIDASGEVIKQVWNVGSLDLLLRSPQPAGASIPLGLLVYCSKAVVHR